MGLNLLNEEMLEEIDKLKTDLRQKQQIFEDTKQNNAEKRRELSGQRMRSTEETNHLNEINNVVEEKYKSLCQKHTIILNKFNNFKDLPTEQIIEQENEIEMKEKLLREQEESINVIEAEQNEQNNESAHNTTDVTTRLIDMQHLLEQLNETLSKENIQNEELNSKLKSLQIKVKTLREKCEQNKLAMKEQSDLKETLEGDLIGLQSECHSLGGPLQEVNAPNSLFDEVNANRAETHDTLDKMNKNYNEIIQKGVALRKQIQTLKDESAFLKFKCDESIKDRNFEEFVVQYTYKDLITLIPELTDHLNSVLEERELLKRKVITPKDNLFVFEVLDRIDLKIKDLSPKLINVKCTNSNFKFKITRNEKEIEKLKEVVAEKKKIIEKLNENINIAHSVEKSDEIVCICTLKFEEK